MRNGHVDWSMRRLLIEQVAISVVCSVTEGTIKWNQQNSELTRSVRPIGLRWRAGPSTQPDSWLVGAAHFSFLFGRNRRPVHWLNVSTRNLKWRKQQIGSWLWIDFGGKSVPISGQPWKRIDRRWVSGREIPWPTKYDTCCTAGKKRKTLDLHVSTFWLESGGLSREWCPDLAAPLHLVFWRERNPGGTWKTRAIGHLDSAPC